MTKLNIQNRLDDIRSQVSEKETERDAILSKYGITLEQSEKEHKDFCSSEDALVDLLCNPEGSAAIKKEKGKAYSNQIEIDQLNSTLASGVTLVTTQYLITDSNLVSPAGFHPSEPVFLTNEIMVQTDRLPNHVGEGLDVYDMQELA